MARIRTVKPEFWSSPDTAACRDPWARLLFVAMWNWADDEGRGTANPKELAGFAFPHEEDITSASVRRMLGEIRRAFGVVFYKINGRPYYAIPSWQNHQKIDKRSAGRFPAPEDGDPWDPEDGPGSDQQKSSRSMNLAESSAEPTESTPSPRRTPGAGTVEQGNRGTGEVQTSASADAGMFPDIQPAVRIAPNYDEEFAEFWAAYPLKKGKEPARKAFIKARKSGVTLETLRTGADKYRLEVGNRDPSTVKWAQGWLNDKRWQDYDEPGQPRLRAVSGGYQGYRNPVDMSVYHEEL